MDPLPKSDSMLVNLIHRVLNLQGHNLVWSQTDRLLYVLEAKCEKRQANLFWRVTQPIYLETAPIRCRFEALSDALSRRPEDSETERNYCSLLRPSSKVLDGCLGLLMAWFCHIPQKKVRLIRLMKSLDGLYAVLSSELQNATTKQNVPFPEKSFENSFSAEVSPVRNDRIEKQSHFLVESVAYMRIVSVTREKSTTSSFSEFIQRLWRTIADERLQMRQVLVRSGIGERQRFAGDPYKLLSNSKIMATLYFLLLNVSPWHLTLGKNLIQLADELREADGESFLFLLSSIFACLDCLLDVEVETHIFSHFYKLLVLIFQTMTASIRSGKAPNVLDHVKINCFSMMAPILTRCIKAHLSSQFSVEGGMHVRFFLSAVRAAQTFLTTKPFKTYEPTTVVVETDDDESVWGGLNDDVLANLNLDCSVPFLHKEKENLRVLQLWGFLRDIIEMSKVSREEEQ